MKVTLFDMYREIEKSTKKIFVTHRNESFQIESPNYCIKAS
jgi:hypothetical protein